MVAGAINFSSYATGSGVPTGWTERWNTGDVDVAIVTTPSDLGGKALELAHTVTNRYMISLDALDGSTTIEVLAKVQTDTSSTTNEVMSVFARGSGATGSESGYSARPQNGDNTGRLRTWNSDALNATTLSRQLDLNTWYWVRFQLNGTAIKMKIWEDGFAEPPWQIEYTSSVHSSGWVGLGGWEGTMYCDYFAYETTSGNWPIASPVESAATGYELNQADTYTPAGRAPYVEISENHKVASKNVASSDSNTAVRSVGSKTSGKWYFEVHLDVMPANNMSFGWMDATHSELSIIGNRNTDVGVGYWSGGRFYYDGTYLTLTSFTLVADDYGMFAIDFATGNCWVGRNGTWYNSGDPGAGTNPTHTESEIIGATLYPAVQVYDKDAPNTLTIRLSPSEFEGTLPTGFSALESDGTTTTTTTTTTSTTSTTVTFTGSTSSTSSTTTTSTTTTTTTSTTTTTTTTTTTNPYWVWYKGEPFFILEPNIMTPFEDIMEQSLDKLEFHGIGQMAIDYAEAESTFKFMYNFYSQAEAYAMHRFFDEVAGMHKGLWFSTWEMNMKPAAAFDAADLTITIEDSQWEERYKNKATGKYVIVVFPDNNYSIRKVDTADANSVTFTTAVGQSVAANELDKCMISFFLYGRFDKDAMSIDYLSTSTGKASIQFHSLPFETEGVTTTTTTTTSTTTTSTSTTTTTVTGSTTTTTTT